MYAGLCEFKKIKKLEKSHWLRCKILVPTQSFLKYPLLSSNEYLSVEFYDGSWALNTTLIILTKIRPFQFNLAHTQA